MNSFFDIIFEHYIQSEGASISDACYQTYRQKSIMLEQSIKGTLENAQAEQLEKLIDAITSAAHIETKAAFAAGFKLGAKCICRTSGTVAIYFLL